jgi:hypothetical protein
VKAEQPDLHLVLRLKMSGGIPPTPSQCAFMAYTGTPVPLHLRKETTLKTYKQIRYNILLKWMLKKQEARLCFRFSWLMIRFAVAACYRHGNGPSAFVEDPFLD